MVELAANAVRLRALSTLDQAKLATLCNNKKIWDNVRDLLPYPYSEEDAIEFIARCQKENPPGTFVIEFEGDWRDVLGWFYSVMFTN